MFTKFSILVLLVMTFTVTASTGDPFDTVKVLNDSAIATLTDARCAEVKTGSASEITCFLSFPDSVPQLFYEIDPAKGELHIKLLTTKAGEYILKNQVQPVNQGPIKSMVISEEILNKNEAMPSLTPEWYSVVLVTLAFHPMIRRQEDIVVSEMENAITVSFPWPDKLKERKNYYLTTGKRRRTGIIASIIGIGTVGLAGGGYYAYKHYFSEEAKADQPLDPVMPDHPSAP